MKIQLRQYTLPLQHTFGISRERYDTQDTLIVALEYEGKVGYGEATSNPYYQITTASLKAEIEALRREISDFKIPAAAEEVASELAFPLRFEQWMQTRKLSNFARCALDLACWDLYGKLKGTPVYKLWGTELQNLPTSNFTIGLDRPEVMVAKMQEKPWPIYKIKLGTSNDVGIVTELRRHTDAVFRVDANCAWTADETIQNARALKELGVEFLEQPLKADDWEGMERVAHQSVLPIIADESCIIESDVARCALHFHGINIKLTKCGGLTPALRMIREARELGLKVMVGCMTESTVGISAIAQLLPQLDYVDMDGALLLREDIARGVSLREDASIVYPEIAGSGVELISP